MSARLGTVRKLVRLLAVVVLLVVGGASSAGAAEPGAPAPRFNANEYDQTLRRCGADGVDGGCGTPADGSVTLLGSAFGSDDAGRAGIPSGNYDIGYSDSTFGVGDKIFSGLTSAPFAWSKLMTTGSTNILRWAFGFKVADVLAEPTQDIASDYHAGLEGDAKSPSAYGLALFVCTAMCGWWALRGRGTKAIGELAVTYLIYAGFLAFIALVPNGFSSLMTNSLASSGQTAGGIGAVSLYNVTDTATCPPATGEGGKLENVACPFGRALHAAVVEKPYDLVNWGADLGSGGDPNNPHQACAKARDKILFSGPHGAADKPREMMSAAGEPCERFAKFNESASADRMVLAASNAVVATLVGIVILLIAAVLIAVQLLFAFAISLAPFAVVFGLMPSFGRGVFWKWAGMALKSLVTVVAVAVTLCLYLVALSVLLQVTAGAPWFLQAFVMIVPELVMFIVVLVVMWKMVKGARQGAEAIGRRASGAQIGGGHSSFMTGAAAGWAGASLHDHEFRRARMQARRARHHAGNAMRRAGHLAGRPGGRGGRVAAAIVPGGNTGRRAHHGGRKPKPARLGSKTIKLDYGPARKDGAPRKPIITATTRTPFGGRKSASGELPGGRKASRQFRKDQRRARSSGDPAGAATSRPTRRPGRGPGGGERQRPVPATARGGRSSTPVAGGRSSTPGGRSQRPTAPRRPTGSSSSPANAPSTTSSRPRRRPGEGPVTRVRR